MIFVIGTLVVLLTNSYHTIGAINMNKAGMAIGIVQFCSAITNWLESRNRNYKINDKEKEDVLVSISIGTSLVLLGLLTKNFLTI